MNVSYILENITLFHVFQLYEFILELGVVSILFVVRLPRRKNIVLRAVLCAMGCLLLSSIWSRQLSAMLPLAAVRYLLLFAAAAFSIWQCFDCSKSVAVSCAMGSYAVQHIFHKVYTIVEILVRDQLDWLMILLYVVLFLAVCLTARLLFTKNLTAENYRFLESSKNIILCGVILLCTVFFSIVYTVQSANAQPAMLVVCSLYDCACCVMALWVQFGLFEINAVKEEMVVIRQLWQQDKKQMQVAKENIELINIKCHDMKHIIKHLEAKGGHATEKELNSIRELIDIYDFSVDTGNATLNLVLAEKSLICREREIRLNCIADGGKLGFMEETDIYSLFSNALDNAISAVNQFENKDKRVIALTVKSALGFISVCIENYYNAELIYADGLPMTSKEDKNNHGYGMKSMRYVVERYGGEMTVCSDGEVFTLTLLIPYQEAK